MARATSDAALGEVMFRVRPLHRTANTILEQALSAMGLRLEILLSSEKGVNSRLGDEQGLRGF
jgi:hypothetical protein